MAKENTMCEEFRKSNYETIEERIRVRDVIHQSRGEDYMAEEFVKVCKMYGIEVPITPPAFGWEP